MFIYIFLLCSCVSYLSADVRQYYCCSATQDFLVEMLSTVTACYYSLQEDFNNTWTQLEPLNTQASFEAGCNNLHADNNSTWTILQDIKTDQSICCAQLQQDFGNTWTVLATLHIPVIENLGTQAITLSNINNLMAQDFNYTWTTIAALNALITQDFNNTCTVLADIKNNNSSCCAQLQQDFNYTWTALAALQSNMSQVVSSVNNEPTSITSVPYTINTAGVYCLATNASISSGIAITINADDVVIDMCDHTLANTGTASIGINAQTQRKNITIKNGCIKNFSTYGIAIGISGSFSQNIAIDDLTTTGCGTGIFWAAVQDSYICRYKSCLDNNNGICLDNGSRRCVIESSLVNDVVLDSGLTVTGSSTDITVKNSEFHHNTGSGISCRQSTSYVSVHRCICNGNVKNGIELLSGIANCLLMENEVFNNTLNGIINSGSNNQVFKTVARGNGTNYTGVSLTATSLLGLGPWDNLSL